MFSEKCELEFTARGRFFRQLTEIFFVHPEAFGITKIMVMVKNHEVKIEDEAVAVGAAEIIVTPHEDHASR